MPHANDELLVRPKSLELEFGPKQCHIALVIMVAKPIESLIYCLPLAKCAKRKKFDINHIDQDTILCQNCNVAECKK